MLAEIFHGAIGSSRTAGARNNSLTRVPVHTFHCRGPLQSADSAASTTYRAAPKLEYDIQKRKRRNALAHRGSLGPLRSRYLPWDRHASERILVILALAILTPPPQARQTEQARTQFECASTKVIMTNKAGQMGSVQVEEHMIFSIDDAAKTFIFSDGRRLRITRFDKSWISGNSEDIQYEFNRADRTLTYAGSTTKDNVTTTVVGSGLCEDTSTEKT